MTKQILSFASFKKHRGFFFPFSLWAQLPQMVCQFARGQFHLGASKNSLPMAKLRMSKQHDMIRLMRYK